LDADLLIRKLSTNILFIVDSTLFFKQVVWWLNLIMSTTSLNKLWCQDEQFKAYLSVYSVEYDDERLLFADFKTASSVKQDLFLYSQTVNT
jgi:hypothetical protein